MNEHKRLIVVPWDFTLVAENALAHAVRISRMTSNDVCLLHIINPGIKPKEEREVAHQLKRVADEASKKYNMIITYQLVKGSIFTDIADFVNSKEANLVVMGTHGMKGMQKITGSWALKVIVKSKVPFIVVQDPPADQERYHNIVFPVDFRIENKEKWNGYFHGKIFRLKNSYSEVDIEDTFETEDQHKPELRHKISIQNNIEYEIHEIPRGNLAQKTIDFAQKINADLILIMTTKHISMADYMLGASSTYHCQQLKDTGMLCQSKSSFTKVGQFMYAERSFKIPYIFTGVTIKILR